MALIILAGAPVLSGRLTMPLRGPWTFDGKVDANAVPTGQVLLACDGGLQLTGTVDAARSGVVLDSAHVRVVAGAGGLGRPVSGAFRSAQLRDPVGAILAAAGETLSGTVDASLLSTALPRWSIGTASASSALSALCTYASGVTGSPVNWRVLGDGTVWIGVETWPAAALDALDAVSMVHPTLSQTVVGVSVPTIGPAVTIEGVGQVASVEHRIDNRSGIETWLYVDATTGSPAALFQRNARAALHLDPDPDSFPRLDRLALYPARVDAAAPDGSTVDVTPLNAAVEPQMDLPLRQCAAGDVVVPKAGAVLRVGWDEGDPSKMYALALYDSGDASKRSISADALTFNSGTKGAARVDDTLTASAALATWAGAVESAITGLGGVAPVPPFASGAGVANGLGKVGAGSSTVKVG